MKRPPSRMARLRLLMPWMMALVLGPVAGTVQADPVRGSMHASGAAGPGASGGDAFEAAGPGAAVISASEGDRVNFSIVAAGDELAWETQSVRELLRREIHLALRADPRLPRGQAGAAPAARPPAPEGQPELLALYGMGRRLMAEVRAGSRLYVYVRGQPRPLGVSADAPVWRLQAISERCVRLEHQGEERSLCLRNALAGGDS